MTVLVVSIYIHLYSDLHRPLGYVGTRPIIPFVWGSRYTYHSREPLLA